MVFYRKYRPQKISELDNEEIREKLQSVLSKPSGFHAFLFTGPKGLGKTSAARIVAKVLNCERLVNKRLGSSSKGGKLYAKNYTLSANIEPCNKCYQCTSITTGNNLDVLEIDAASNRGIDEIRDLREKIRLGTAKAAKKVYIIDEVHMLTPEAFNALLKTLEEPPSHAVFILCTTEPQKIPGTIVSRCLHISFSLATTEELKRSLKRIVSKEKIAIDGEAMDKIASLSDGSFRDGTKILEEITFVSKGRKITKELVEKKFQISNVQHQITALLDSLHSKDTKAGLELVKKLKDDGVDMKYFLEELMKILHSSMLSKLGVSNSQANIDLKFTIEETKKLLQQLGRATLQLKYAVLPQLPLELVIIEWSMKDGEVKT